MATPSQDVGVRYRSVRRRLGPLLRELPDAPGRGWNATVDACPGWRVRDVVAHLLGNLEDGAAGRIDGPPSPSQSAEQVERHREDDVGSLMDTWEATAGFAEASFSESGAWPVFIDALSHEHDIRAAIGQPGARADIDVLVAARVLAQWGEGDSVKTGTPFDLVLDDAPPRRLLIGSGDPVVLSTDSFTWVRLRLGRRSVEEVRALSWSSDPALVLDRLFVFGPRVSPSSE